MQLHDQLRDLVRSVEVSDIASIDRLKPERRDLLVTCASGCKHLLRLEDHAVSLLRQKWGYERLREGGVPCPEIEAFLEPDGDDGSGCLVLSWVDAVPAAHLIEREGPGKRSHALCRKLGRALRGLHSVPVTGPVPEYVSVHTREGARTWSRQCFAGLRAEGMVDASFEDGANRLVDVHLHLIPDPYPRFLCFTDMHFYNVLVRDGTEPEVAAFVDIEEIGVGWPMWDFTNWECWGMRFGRGWTREPIMAGYGDLDMLAYRLALLIRLSRPFTFVGSTREQIVRAVEAQDLAQFELDELYR
jgi:aminoglycoside phosphotransferase (APT) family kinase protein